MLRAMRPLSAKVNISEEIRRLRESRRKHMEWRAELADVYERQGWHETAARLRRPFDPEAEILEALSIEDTREGEE